MAQIGHDRDGRIGSDPSKVFVAGISSDSSSYHSLARSSPRDEAARTAAGWCVIIDANSFGRSANYIWLGRGPLFASRRVRLAGGEIFVDFTKE